MPPVHRHQGRTAATWWLCGPASDVNRQHLERVVALVAQGAVRRLEVTRYRLSEAAAAHQLSESRHFRGKLVFQVR